MKALNKYLIALSILVVSGLAQAEGVSKEDIERGNNPSSESAVIASGH